MKRLLHIILTAAAPVVLLASCFGIDREDYPELSPITIIAASDTINAQVHIPLDYKGISVQSELPYSVEWAWGEAAGGTTIEQGQFSVRKYLSSTSLGIGETFSEVGSYVLRLKVDNGESIAYKFFRLNVNSGYDEGVAILDRADDGSSAIAFVRTLTTEEKETGEQQIYYFDPVGGLRGGVSLFCTDASLSYGAGTQTAFVILTDTDIYLLDSKTLELVQSASMKEFGTVPKEVAGEYARVNDMSLYFLGVDGRVFRYDMLLGYLNVIDSFLEPSVRAFPALNRTIASGASTRYPFFFNERYIFTRQSSSSGTKTLKADEGWKIVNAACGRTMNNPVYVVLRSESDPSSFRIRHCRLNPQASILYDSWESEVYEFSTSDLKMDGNSIMLGTKASNDIYYSYGNSIWRWGLTTAPPSTPAITLAAGEIICDMATNYMGARAAGVNGPDFGEDLLYIATYNPSRSSDKKGSLYVYSFASDSQVAAYEGICNKPQKVIYKYRMN